MSPSHTSGRERRQAWRFPTNLEMKVQRGSGVARNLSASGVLFETDDSFAPGQPITFSFTVNHLDSDFPVHLECQGTVVRVEWVDRRMHVAATIESYSFDPSQRPGLSFPIPSGGPGDGAATGAPARDGVRTAAVRPGISWRRSPSLRSPQGGFSTSELMITVAISSILALIAIAFVGNALQTDRTRAAAHQVASAMQLARQYAVSNFATYTVNLTGTTIGVTCTATCPPSPPAEATEPIQHGATTSTPATPISFGPLGTGLTPGTVTVSSPGSPNWQVQVTAGGRVRVCSPTCS